MTAIGGADLISATLSNVNSSFFRERLTKIEINAYADAMTDMLCLSSFVAAGLCYSLIDLEINAWAKLLN